jgi:hypothetical protein
MLSSRLETAIFLLSDVDTESSREEGSNGIKEESKTDSKVK